MHASVTITARVWMLLRLIGDIAALFAFFLQQTLPELPQTIDDILETLNPALLDSMWLIPCASAAAFPIIGAIAGVFCQKPWALWLYAAYAATGAVVRTYLLFVMKQNEGHGQNRALLLEMLIETLCVLLQLTSCSTAAGMALDFEATKISHLDASSRRSRSREAPRHASSGMRGGRSDPFPSMRHRCPPAEISMVSSNSVAADISGVELDSSFGLPSVRVERL